MRQAIFRWLAAVILLATATSVNAQKLDPRSNINWNLTGGSGTPTSLGLSCSASNIGQPYTNTAVTPNDHYKCGTDGWEKQGKDYPGITVDGSSRTSVNTNVNSQLNVMTYGAKGDCSTDDHDAIVAAMTAAMTFANSNTLPAALVFPKPPGGCYLTSTLPFYGISLVGQTGGIGEILGRSQVVIRGKPGQDILAAPDPSTSVSAYPWYVSWTIRDISFQLDLSIAGNFPHRWPGRWIDSVSTTAGSSNLIVGTTVSSGSFSCGDVGEAIQINGAGSGGSNLVTTIASISPCTRTYQAGTGGSGFKVVTLATNALTSVTNAHTYVSLLGLPVTKQIGNCAISFPEKDALPSNWPIPTQSYGQGMDEITNVTFGQVFGTSAGNGCAIFSQGHQSPYQFTVRNVNVAQMPFGIVEGTSELNSANASSGNDFQIWDHMWFFGDIYPWISYNGGGNTISNWQLSVAAGPQILQSDAANGDCACGWSIQTGGFEITGPNSGYGVRIEGSGNILRGVTGGVSGMTSSINGTNIYGYADSGGSTMNITGANIDINLGQGSADPSHYHDYGTGNKIVGSYGGTNATGLQPNHPISLFPYKGESEITGRITAAFVRDGNYATPYNWDDLMFWPQDFILAATAFTPTYSALYIPDTTSPTGAEIAFTSSTFLQNFNQSKYDSVTNPNQTLTVGTNLPASKADWYFMAKCPVGTTAFSFSIKDSTNVIRSTATGSCNTTLQMYKGPTVDLSALTGNSIGFIGGNASPNSLLVAWVALRPFLADVNGKTIPGAGAAIATGPTTSTLHDCPWFTDTVGTIGDSGSGCSGGGGLSGQTTGYLPKATSSTGSTTSSAIDDGLTSGYATVHEKLQALVNANETFSVGGGCGTLFASWCYLNNLNSSGAQSILGLAGGAYIANTGIFFGQYNPTLIRYWGEGLLAQDVNLTYLLHDYTNSKNILSFPNNTYTGSTAAYSVNANGPVLALVTPATLYSAAGTALPSCASGLKGTQAVVSDATSPTYMGAYTSGGGITAAVICSYNGSTYSWLTH
jgi:hypothetical protein